MLAVLELYNQYGFLTKVNLTIPPDILIDTQVNEIAQNFSKSKFCVLTVELNEGKKQVFRYAPSTKVEGQLIRVNTPIYRSD